MVDVRQYALNMYFRSREAPVEATYLASEEDAQFSLPTSVKQTRSQFVQCVGVLGDLIISWSKPQLKDPTLNWTLRSFAG